MKMHQLKNSRNNAQAGFTLIELIVVIVILGILAATAIPKFSDLGTDARIAKMNAAKASVQTGAALYHASWLAKGSLATLLAIDGVAGGAEGYPTAAVGGIDVAAGGLADYTFVAGVITPDATTARSGCKVTYTATTGAVVAALAEANCK